MCCDGAMVLSLCIFTNNRRVRGMETWLIPLAGMVVPVAIIAIIFYYVLEQRRMLHRERLAMIEKGLAPHDLQEIEHYPQRRSRQRILSDGIITTAVGMALLLGLGSIGMGPWLLGGLIPVAVGIGNIITYVATSDEDKKSDQQ